MNTEEHIDNIITNLKIIGMVKNNGRLCVRKGGLALEPDDYFQTVRRWVNKDSREITLMHVRNTISNAIKLLKSVKNGQVEVQMRDWTISRIVEEMINCQDGLNNLKTTYATDAALVASIDVLLERLEANCKIEK